MLTIRWSSKRRNTPSPSATPCRYPLHGYGDLTLIDWGYLHLCEIDAFAASVNDGGVINEISPCLTYSPYTEQPYLAIRRTALSGVITLAYDEIKPIEYFNRPLDEVNGCGHGSYFKDVDGNYWVCYHGYIGKDTSSGRYSHLERIYVTSDGVSIGNGSGHPAPLDTVYTINLNPMPLAEKISGFAFKEVQSPENPFDNKDTDTNTNTGVDTGSDTQSPSTSDTPSIIVIVMVIIAAAVVVAGAAVFSIVKKKKSAATAANDSHVSGDDTDKK